MKERFRSEQMYAWVHFATVAYSKLSSAPAAAKEADRLQVEFDKRFIKDPCDNCHGTGSVSRAMAAGNATGRFTCDVCGGTGEKP
jgi:hypothetical protein